MKFDLNSNLPVKMKSFKNTLLLLSIVILYSCAGAINQTAYVSNKAYIGMPISEFKSVAGKKANLEAMESGYTVYRVNNYDFQSGIITDTKFYYFDENGTLVRIDSGQFKQSRYQIEIK